jgi:fucose 4-O-acetylase-like acetyltransferase
MRAPYWMSKGLNLPALEKSRLHWVDYLKGIAIFQVVYRHILIGMDRSGQFIDNVHHVSLIPGFIWNANNVFYSFRMPLFFILSGVFLQNSLKKRSTGTFLVNRFEYLIYPYFIWASIQIAMQLAAPHAQANSDRSWQDFGYIFYQPQQLDQFWYLPALFNCTLVYTLAKVYGKIPGWLQLAIGVGLFMFYWNTPHIDRYSMFTDWMRFYIYFALGDVLTHFFFSKAFQKFMHSPWSLLLLTPVFAATQYYYLHSHLAVPAPALLGISLVGCTTMFVCAGLLERWNILNFLRIFGYHSLYIYVIHVMVAAMVRNFLVYKLHIHDVYAVLFLGIFLAMLIPVFFYNYLVKDGPLWWLFYFRKSSMHEREKSGGQRTSDPVVPLDPAPAPGDNSTCDVSMLRIRTGVHGLVGLTPCTQACEVLYFDRTLF